MVQLRNKNMSFKNLLDIKKYKLTDSAENVGIFFAKYGKSLSLLSSPTSATSFFSKLKFNKFVLLLRL